MSEKIEDLEHRVSVKQQELGTLRQELRVAREEGHPFKIGQEVEAHTYVTSKRRYDFQRAMLVSIRFFDLLEPEYKVVFLKKDGTWSTKPRYTHRIRPVSA